MRAPRSGLVAALAGLAVLVAACRSAVVAPPPPAGAATSVDAVRRLLADRESETRTLTATFKLALRRADGATESSRGALVVARPDRLRLQVFAFGMITAYDYTVNGDRYRARRPLDGFERVGRFGESQADDALGADLRPLFLSTGDFAAARVEDAGDAFLVRVADRGGERRIEVSKADGRIDRETLAIDGEPRIVSEYSDYRSVDGVALPYAIRVAYPAKQVALAIDVDRYTRNQPAGDELFEF